MRLFGGTSGRGYWIGQEFAGWKCLTLLEDAAKANPGHVNLFGSGFGIGTTVGHVVFDLVHLFLLTVDQSAEFLYRYIRTYMCV